MSTRSIRTPMRALLSCWFLTALVSGCSSLPLLSSNEKADSTGSSSTVAIPGAIATPPAGNSDEASAGVSGTASSGAVSALPLRVPPDVKIDRQSEALFGHSLDALRAGEYEKAEILLLELTEHRPDLSGPWVNLGSVYSHLGNNDAAEAAYQHALEVNPDNCAAYNQLGVLSREAGDFLAAEANYLACIQRVPDFREAYLNLGILYELYLGKLGEAMQAYRNYQALLDKPDKKVKGWLMDLERRISAGGAS